MAKQKTGTGRVALVTGASSGIGQATAVELARCGYQIAIHYHSNEKGARQTLEKIRSLEHGRARVYAFDVSNPAEVAQIAGEILEDFGRMDALINNAGTLIRRQPLAEMDFEHWRQTVAINLDSVFLVTRVFLPCMIQQRSGCIVNVASLAARTGGGIGAGAYAAAKAGVITLTKAMAKELIHFGIRVNCVNPGLIDTPFHERLTPKEMMNRFLSAVPQGRCGSSEEIAKVISFLASEDASFMLGECVEVNGGMLMD
jgi:NAD(P)-dependent dehydrogenase (short-subunit alcohol dehydrogenase family)